MHAPLEHAARHVHEGLQVRRVGARLAEEPQEGVGRLVAPVGGEKHNISAMSEEDVKQRIEKEVRAARDVQCKNTSPVG